MQSARPRRSALRLRLTEWGAELDVIAAVFVGGASLAGGAGSAVLTAVGVLAIGVMGDGLGLLSTPIE